MFGRLISGTLSEVLAADLGSEELWKLVLLPNPDGTAVEIPADWSPHCVHLVMKGLKIAEVPRGWSPRCVNLNLAENEIREVPDWLTGLYIELDLSGNRIATVPAGWQVQCKRLKLQRNQLTEVPVLPASCELVLADDNPIELIRPGEWQTSMRGRLTLSGIAFWKRWDLYDGLMFPGSVGALSQQQFRVLSEFLEKQEEVGRRVRELVRRRHERKRLSHRLRWSGALKELKCLPPDEGKEFPGGQYYREAAEHWRATVC